jgi:3-phosphoshikimate 1-carboxyvinyltransferase
VVLAPEEIKPGAGAIDAKNSASALALLTGVLVTSKSPVVLTGDSRLRDRPMPGLLRGLRRLGADIHSTKPNDTPPFISFGGGVTGGEVIIGKGEARYLPAFVLSSTRAERRTVFWLPKDSSDVFLDPVREVTAAAGIDLLKKGRKLSIPSERYRSFSYEVGREVVGTAPLILAPLLTGSDLKLKVGKISTRDELFLRTLESFGVGWSKKGKHLSLRARRLRGTRVDLSWGPELLPFVAVLACMARGRTLIHGAGEARDMKSDRISAMARELRGMGAKVLEQSGGLVIQGPTRFRGGEVDGHGDYAVTASLVVAALCARERVVIKNGPEALKTSYPRFITRFREIGAEIGYHGG